MEDVVPKITDGDEIKKEVNNIKSDVRSKVRIEMFGWGDFRMGRPDAWLKLKQNNAIQVPATTAIEWLTDEGRTKATEAEMVKYNDTAMSNYADMVLEYLSQDAPEDKKTVNEVEGITQYEVTLQKLWTRAKEVAKGEVMSEREENNSKKK
jgi:hypothetical protein